MYFIQNTNITSGVIFLNKKIEDIPLILDAKNISEIIGISKRTAYEVMDYPDFPLIRLGRCKRVSRDRFFSWLEQQTLNKS